MTRSERGQVDLAHIATAAVTAAVLAAGGFIWSMLKPEPKLQEERAVESALLKKDVADLKTTTANHDAALRVLVPQVQRIEDVVVRIDERQTGPGGVRPASAAKRQGP